jgi:hypothetical protein
MLQTILFPRNHFTKMEAIQWAINHGYHAYKTDVTTNFIRIRQEEPRSHGNYYTVKLKNGIELVFEK